MYLKFSRKKCVTDGGHCNGPVGLGQPRTIRRDRLTRDQPNQRVDRRPKPRRS